MQSKTLKVASFNVNGIHCPIKSSLICGGDFNIRLNPRIDSSNGKSDSNAISKKVNALMKEVGIIDVWRELYPSGQDFTHFSSPHAVYSRTDYFFTFRKTFTE